MFSFNEWLFGFICFVSFSMDASYLYIFLIPRLCSIYYCFYFIFRKLSSLLVILFSTMSVMFFTTAEANFNVFIVISSSLPHSLYLCQQYLQFNILPVLLFFAFFYLFDIFTTNAFFVSWKTASIGSRSMLLFFLNPWVR